MRPAVMAENFGVGVGSIFTENEGQKMLHFSCYCYLLLLCDLKIC